MYKILVLGAASQTPEGQRAGDLFDFALIEIVRVLDIPANRALVLVPWSEDLAPLVAAGIADTGPSFDAESGATREGQEPGIIPYLLPGREGTEQTSLFSASTHLSPGSPGPMPFADALKSHSPTHIVMLAWTDDSTPVRAALRGTTASLVTFGSLMSPARVADLLEIDEGSVTDLELRLGPLPARDAPDSSEFASEGAYEAELEPFIPFGLLIQDYFGDLLSADETR